MSILGSVGPVGTLETEIQASQAGSFKIPGEVSCLASLDLGLQSTHTTRVPNIDTFNPGLPPLGHRKMKGRQIQITQPQQ